MFSERTAWDRTPNALAIAVEAARRRGPLLDLTESNPTRVGLNLPGEAILAALADPELLHYDPHPFGLRRAREALCRHYAELGAADLAPDDLVLTASSSESYSLLFKTLCDAGDNVLIPAPCYPLFGSLAGLENVSLRSYPLERVTGFGIDLQALERAVDGRSRAVLVVNPGNPTGTYLRRDEHAQLQALCSRRGMALISDEVFSVPEREAALPPEILRTVASSGCDALTFSLGGLSKLAGLPQLKLGWMAISGPAELKREALARLELVTDTYLSVNTPVQLAAEKLLRLAPAIREQLRARIQRNKEALALARPAGAPWTVLDSEGGWQALIHLPRWPGEEELTLRLVEKGVLVHPGHFFDFPGGQYLIVSLLCASEVFDAGLRRIVAEVG